MLHCTHQFYRLHVDIDNHTPPHAPLRTVMGNMDSQSTIHFPNDLGLPVQTPHLKTQQDQVIWKMLHWIVASESMLPITARERRISFLHGSFMQIPGRDKSIWAVCKGGRAGREGSGGGIMGAGTDSPVG